MGQGAHREVDGLALTFAGERREHPLREEPLVSLLRKHDVRSALCRPGVGGPLPGSARESCPRRPAPTGNFP